MPYTYPYPRPALTADAVVFTIQDQQLQVLLIQRAAEPFKGFWALPGGFVEEGETTADAVRRELEEEAGVRDVSFDQLRTFDAPGRDPRGWIVTVAYLALIDAARVHPVAADDAADARWWPAADLPPIAGDHEAIIGSGLERMRAKQRISVIGSQLLAPLFTMEALRRVHEAVLDHTLDPIVFEKHVLDSGAIRDSGPKLYAFVRRDAV
ncbi:MAG: NUDIX domain-containing protein [Chloroflexota bacterium]